MPTTPSDAPDIHYNRVSHAWRHLMGKSFHYGYFDTADQELDAATRAMTRRMAERGQLRRGECVLDIGCGIGEPARFLAQSIGCRVTGISTSATGVALAEEESAAAGVADLVTFEVRDGMANGFPDEHFDRVWAMESSHLMHDKPAMIREAARVLVPGGKLVLCDIIVQRDLPIRDVVHRAHDFDLLRRVFGRAKMETLLTYCTWLAEAGLGNIQAEDISQRTRPTLDRWQANAIRFREQVIALIDVPGWTDFTDSCDVLRTMWDEAILGYGLITAEKRL